MYCSNCGSNLNIDARFCSVCGEKSNSNSGPQQYLHEPMVRRDVAPPKPRWLKILAWIFVLGAVGNSLRYIESHYFGGDFFATTEPKSSSDQVGVQNSARSTHDALVLIADEANKYLPRRVNGATWEKVVPGDNMLLYVYKIDNSIIARGSTDDDWTGMRANLLREVCSNKFSSLLDMGIELKYAYVDDREAPLQTISFSKADCALHQTPGA